MIRLLCCIAVLLSLTSCANLNKKPKFLLTFHTQGTEMDSPRSVFPYVLPGENRKVIMKWIPEFTHDNVSAFQPFKADDGKTNGATFKLDFRGTNALSMVSRTQQGQIIMTLLNGKPIGYLTLDKPSGDGLITVWDGITDAVLKEMSKKYPPIKGLQSVSNAHPDMLPTTNAEKKRAVDYANAVKKAEDKKAALDAKKAAEEAKHPSAAKPSAPDLNAKFDPAPQAPQPMKRPPPIPYAEPPISPVPPRQ